MVNSYLFHIYPLYTIDQWYLNYKHASLIFPLNKPLQILMQIEINFYLHLHKSVSLTKYQQSSTLEKLAFQPHHLPSTK